MTVPLPDLATALRWVVPLWESRPIPTRIHVRAVEPESKLGSPKLHPGFLAWLAAHPFDKQLVLETRRCYHPRGSDSDPFGCRDCQGGGTYQAERLVYRDPLRAALEALRRRPGQWSGPLSPAGLLRELAARDWNVRALAFDHDLEADVAAQWALLAIRRLANRYREEPQPPAPWIEKSEAQQAAEAVA